MVHVNGNTNEAESEVNTALRRVTNMNRFQHAEWATVLELRAMAMALQKIEKNVCDCHGKHTQHKVSLCLLPSATMVKKRCEGPTFPTM